MSVVIFFTHIKEAFHGAGSIVKHGTKNLLRDPHILLYPYLAVLFVIITSPLISKIVLPLWHKIDQPQIIDMVGSSAPDAWLARLGLVTFSVFYTVFITSFFVCAMSAVTLARLDGHKVSPLYGLVFVSKNFFRVAKFSLLAILFLPMGLFVQRHKFKSLHGSIDAISSSLSLSMCQLSPAIVRGHSGISTTIKQSLATLGHYWKESLVIRLGTFLGILFLGSLSFMPKLIENYWFDDKSAHAFGWIITILLGASSYVAIRVASTVYTTTLYHRAELNKKSR